MQLKKKSQIEKVRIENKGISYCKKVKGKNKKI